MDVNLYGRGRIPDTLLIPFLNALLNFHEEDRIRNALILNPFHPGDMPRQMADILEFHLIELSKFHTTSPEDLCTPFGDSVRSWQVRETQ